MLRAFVLCLLLCAAAAATAFADGMGSIHGSVTDTNGKPIADAELTANSPLSHATTKTDGKGQYEFAALMPGTYMIFAEHQRYFTAAVWGIPVKSDARIALQFRLVAASVAIIDGPWAWGGLESLLKPGTTADVYVVRQSLPTKSTPANPSGALLFVPGVVPSFSAPVKY